MPGRRVAPRPRPASLSAIPASTRAPGAVSAADLAPLRAVLTASGLAPLDADAAVNATK